jgi:exodeoxyribonuclease VII large subunit
MKGDRQTLDLFGGEVKVDAAPSPPAVTPPRVLSRPLEREPVLPVVVDPLDEGHLVGPGISVFEREEDHHDAEDDVQVRVSEPRVWTVAEVNRSVKEMLEDYLPPLWVSGEVANWTAHRSGHRYFTLKDDQAQIRCVMFRSDARQLPIDPDDGMNVRVFGGLTLYEARGEYQMTVRRLEAQDAEGLWRMAFEKLRKKLDAEGLLDPRRKRPLPRFPRTVGIVTSTTGAALRDILTVLRRRAPWTRVVVRSCRVQGEGAAVDVADAIRVLAASGRVDVMIVGRGGGSIEDLWAFNEEAVARAIAACPLPVISAVGHEVDVTIADLVADYRAPTPSAAAEAVVQDGLVLRDALRLLPTRLSRALRGAVDRRGRRIADAGVRLERAVQGRIVPVRDRIGRAEERMGRSVDRRLERRRQALAALAGKLDALSPLSVLGRGYAVAIGEGGHVLRRTSDFPTGTEFKLRVSDGDVDCRATGETA